MDELAQHEVEVVAAPDTMTYSVPGGSVAMSAGRYISRNQKQFGDVHVGVCALTVHPQSEPCLQLVQMPMRAPTGTMRKGPSFLAVGTKLLADIYLAIENSLATSTLVYVLTLTVPSI